MLFANLVIVIALVLVLNTDVIVVDSLYKTLPVRFSSYKLSYNHNNFHRYSYTNSYGHSYGNSDSYRTSSRNSWCNKRSKSVSLLAATRNRNNVDSTTIATTNSSNSNSGTRSNRKSNSVRISKISTMTNSDQQIKKMKYQDKLKQLLLLYYNINKSTEVPTNFCIPANIMWPEEFHGLQLGLMLKKALAKHNNANTVTDSDTVTDTVTDTVASTDSASKDSNSATDTRRKSISKARKVVDNNGQDSTDKPSNTLISNSNTLSNRFDVINNKSFDISMFTIRKVNHVHDLKAFMTALVIYEELYGNHIIPR